MKFENIKYWINGYVFGKPQPVRLYPIVPRKEKLSHFIKEWESAIIGFLIAVSIIMIYVPFF